MPARRLLGRAHRRAVARRKADLAVHQGHGVIGRAMEDPVAAPRQRALFSGLDCLPGQMDLFPTDGEPEEPEHAATGTAEKKHDDPDRQNPCGQS